jgi:hypothetical protein
MNYEVVSTLDAWGKYFAHIPTAELVKNDEFKIFMNTFGIPKRKEIKDSLLYFWNHFQPPQISFVFNVISLSERGAL